MSRPRFARLSLIIVLFMFASVLLQPSLATAATATATDISNPDAYTCGQSGYIDFENLSDGANLSSGAISGVQFTTTNGFTWQVGDFATGNYNGKYPNGGYTSQGTHWAWLGVSQGAGRIDFVNGPASVFSLLTSDNLTPVQLDAYKADNTLLATAGPASINYNTGHMAELKITRDTADMAYVIVHDSGNFFLVDSICTDGPGVNALIDFKQNRDPRVAPPNNLTAWAPDHLYDISTCPSMASSGCVITSVTDVLTSYHVQTLPNGKPVDPGTVNHYLGTNKAYHSGCGIFWAPAGKAIGVTLHTYFPPLSLNERIKAVNDALKANKLVIAGIEQKHDATLSHYVVFYKQADQNAPDGSPDYFIADPFVYKPYTQAGNNSGKTLYSAYGQTLKGIDSMFRVIVADNPSPTPGTAWAIVAHSPVQMLITDPDGVRTGFDPVSGTTLLNIPDSSYGREPGIQDDPDVPPTPETLYFGQNDPKNGTYTVQVIGTGFGPYTLDFGSANGSEHASSMSVRGTAVPGQTDTYIVSSVEDLSTIQRQIQIDIKPGSNPAPINVGSQGVIPVAILSDPTFDARTMNFKTVTFGSKKAPALDKQAAIQDVNGDGRLDLVVHFDNTKTGITKGDTQACLAGKTTSGLSVTGCDAIVTVPPGS